jgi:tRNA/tmRNA/rRNA uracil-C5-methylase (TrmA/RlmC/RlmD family)
MQPQANSLGFPAAASPSPNTAAAAAAFSVSFQNSVSRVIGIDSQASAVQDAIHNARANRMHNCKFMLGKVKSFVAMLHSEDLKG